MVEIDHPQLGRTKTVRNPVLMDKDGEVKMRKNFALEQADLDHRAQRGRCAQQDRAVLGRRVHELQRVLADAGEQVEREHRAHQGGGDAGQEHERAVDIGEHGVASRAFGQVG
mgnify:CR=1 FL=1